MNENKHSEVTEGGKTPAITIPGATSTKRWQCPYCESSFDDHRKRIGHVRGMHPDMPVPRRSPEEARLHKMAENKRRREAYWALGLTSSGKPRKTGFRKSPRRVKRGTLPKMSNHERYMYYRDRNRALGLNAKGQPFKIGGKRLASIQHAQKMRRQRELREQARQERFSPIVLGGRQTAEATPDLNSKAINYCPHCGTNIRKYLDQ